LYVSLQKPYLCNTLILCSLAPPATPRIASPPSLCPSDRSHPLPFAQRPLPAIIIATSFGIKSFFITWAELLLVMIVLLIFSTLYYIENICKLPHLLKIIILIFLK